MARRGRTRIALFLGSVALSAVFMPLNTARSTESSAQAAPRSSDLANLEKLVDSVVSETMARSRVAGVQLAIVKDGRPALIKGYGIDSVSPLRNVDSSRSLFRIGSISKVFTWVAIMQLVEQGRIALDNPINLHLPDHLKIPDEGFTKPIRVIDLMNHAAGFEERLGMPLALDGEHLYSLHDYLIRQRPHRVREPGRFVVYSSYGTALAGAIVAHVSGEDFESYIERRILRPLGMNRTTFRAHYDSQAPTASGTPLAAPMPAALVSDLAAGIEWQTGRWISFPQERSLRPPAGGAVSTAEEMATWMITLLDPARLEAAGVLRSSTFALMRKDSFPTAPTAGMRHGFMKMRIGYENLSHGGGVLHFTSLLVIIPDLQLGVFVTANSRTGAELGTRLLTSILNAYFPVPVPRVDRSQRTTRPGHLDGWYLSMLRPETTIRKVLTIPAVIRADITPSGDLSLRAGGWARRLARTGPNEFTPPGTHTTIAFERDPRDGKTYLIDGPTPFERVRFEQTPTFLFICAIAGLVACGGVLIEAFGWRKRPRQESRWESYSRVVLNAVAGTWLLAFLLVGIWLLRLQLAEDSTIFLLEFPQPLMKWASAVLSASAIFTLLALVTLIPTWYRGSWSWRRRAGHTAALMALATLIVALDSWNLVGLRFFD